jgi:hypothetical protein
MNDGPWKFHTGYPVEGLELLIRKVAYTKYDAAGLVRWSNYNLCNVLPEKTDKCRTRSFSETILFINITIISNVL